MTGSSPRPPRRVKRRRSSSPSSLPLALMGALFITYVLIGLLLSVPTPPFWVWAPAIVGTVLMSLGLNRPVAVLGKGRDWMSLFAYVGALFLVVALAIATNYIGGGQSFDNIRFFVGLLALALLTLLALVLTATAAIVNAQTGEHLRRTMDYNRSLTTVIGTCLAGICIGGFAGFLTLALAANS